MKHSPFQIYHKTNPTERISSTPAQSQVIGKIREQTAFGQIYFCEGGNCQQLVLQGMDCESGHEQMQQEQIMIEIEGLFEPEDDPDLLDLLGSEPVNHKKGSLTYDYEPAPLSPMSIQTPQTEEGQAGYLKTSNTSTSTCNDSEAPELPVRKCTCTKTKCQKNYCECFKLGQPCGSSCECRDCGNKEKLFLNKAIIKIKCKCLKSHCLKRYCQCHYAGQKCGPECRCLECQNFPIDIEEQLPSHFDHRLFFDI